jgi:peptidyl-dipeptidase Dcp
MNNVAYMDKFDNSNVVMEIVRLRHEKATLLGYKNYAEYVLSDQMAESPENVMDFLEKNLKVYKPAAEKELEEIKDFAANRDGLQKSDFKPWDYSYYFRALKEERFQFDSEELRPYFELENVLRGMFDHFEKLFDIKVTETTSSYESFDKDQKIYEVTDNNTGDILGLLYCDNYARPGEKNSGAWMSEIRARGDYKGVNVIPIITNNCNFSKPTPGHPTLLSIREVETLFHEAGHGFHGLLAKGKYPSLTGTSVKRDFVELPSQLQENWVHQKDVLDNFAKHYKTGKAIPQKLIKKMKESGQFGNGYAGLRQTFFGLLDMAWHTTDPKNIGSVEALEDKINAKSFIFDREAGPMSTHFGHLFAGGYAAGYYGYKWAEVLDADVFSTLFLDKGLYNRQSADSLRQQFKDLMGREPDQNALFKREGLLKPNHPPAPKQAPKSPNGP